MLQKPNLLIFDEPTNHLDLESINALNIALQKFEGTVLMVTHDQDLLEEVGTRVWHFDHGRIVDFKGTFEEYRGVGATMRDGWPESGVGGRGSLRAGARRSAPLSAATLDEAQRLFYLSRFAESADTARRADRGQSRRISPRGKSARRPSISSSGA